jgi:hypothetical protein
MSKAVKIKIYITIVKSTEVNRSETWPMTEMDIKTMNTCQRNILRRNMYVPVVEQKIWKIRTNQELQELYKDSDKV